MHCGLLWLRIPIRRICIIVELLLVCEHLIVSGIVERLRSHNLLRHGNRARDAVDIFPGFVVFIGDVADMVTHMTQMIAENRMMDFILRLFVILVILSMFDGILFYSFPLATVLCRFGIKA